MIPARFIAKAFCAGLIGGAILAASFVEASAQPNTTFGEQLAGTWKLASITNTRVDGTKYDLFGKQANGLLILDGKGRYSLQIFRRTRPSFAGARMEGTAEENKAAFQGMISHFGSYTIKDDDRSIVLNVESSSYPNWDGTQLTRPFVLLVDQLSWSDPLPPSGPESTDVRSDLVWLRVNTPAAASLSPTKPPN